MPRTSPKKTILFGERTYPTIYAEVLHIGEHPTGYSYQKHVVVALDNDKAIDFIERGYNVRVAREGSKFLGVVQSEHLLYLVIDIPTIFDTMDLSLLQLNLRISESKRALIKVCAQAWSSQTMLGGIDKSGVRFYLEDLSFVDKGVDTRTGFEVLEDLEKVSFAYDAYVQRHRDIDAPVMSKHEWVQRFMRPEITQREYDNRNNPYRTIWAIGDEVFLNGESYVVGNVKEVEDGFSIRLDRKFRTSQHLKVQK